MLNWTTTTITTNRQANEMLKLFDIVNPKIGAFDTETTGLHIILDKPFLFQFGFIDNERKNGWTFAVDLEKQPDLAKQVIDAWHNKAKQLKIYLGHNVKFDLHMLTNAGFEFPTHNLSDTMFYIRYAHDALSPKNGGPPLGLKAYASKYIDATAKSHDNLLQEERTAICKSYRVKLAQKLKAIGFTKLSELDIMFRDAVFDYNELDPKLKRVYENWVNTDLPEYLRDIAVKRMITSDDIRYDKLNRKNLIKYAHFDIVYTLETFLTCEPVLIERENEVAIEFENKVIIPLYEMERTGFLADPEYIEERRKAVKDYIQRKRNVLKELAGREIKISQHALLKKVFNEYFHHEVPSTNNESLLDELSKLKENPEENADIIKFIETIQDLRSLEKWYSTYIIRFQQQLERGYNRLHTQIMQVGTVSGRVTSDFQQFPKEAIMDDEGNELFHPRRMVKAPEGGRLVYMDYSQVELRITAEYTLLVGHPDLNLCRAYTPFQCLERDGKFYLEENTEVEWTPTDLHGASATELYGKHPTDSDWKHWRSKAKTYNFMKNYGGGFTQSLKMFVGDPPEEIKRKDGAYYRVFPGIKAYHDYCYRLADEKSYAMNLFGVKYYGLSGHKIINILGQGSGAFLLKWKIYELWKYLKAHPEIKARYQMNIHDENSWEDPDGDTPYEAFLEMKHIMEDYPECDIPIIAEMAVTYKTWADKKDISTKEEFYAGASH